jgi:two-component system sensor histidine kinase YesM
VVLFSIFRWVFVNLQLSERISVPIKTLERAVKELEPAGEVDIDVSGPYRSSAWAIPSAPWFVHHAPPDGRHHRAGALKRRSELDVLQSQINPHFLYNTLDSVVWMTENGRTDEASSWLPHLPGFSVSPESGSNIIPIDRRAEHARLLPDHQ